MKPRLTCATCGAVLIYPVCDEHPMGRVNVAGVDGSTTCLVCSRKFTRRNPLDKSERRCPKCSADPECNSPALVLTGAEKRRVKKKYKELFPQSPVVGTHFIEDDANEPIGVDEEEP